LKARLARVSPDLPGPGRGRCKGKKARPPRAQGAVALCGRHGSIIPLTSPATDTTIRPTKPCKARALQNIRGAREALYIRGRGEAPPPDI